MSSKKPRKNLTGRISVAIYEEDEVRLKEDAKNSIYRKPSEYYRKLLLGEPVTVFYRNQSFDAFIEEAIVLRKLIEGVRQQGSLTKEGEHRLIGLYEEIKQCIKLCIILQYIKTFF